MSHFLILIKLEFMKKLFVILFGINLLVGCKDKSPIPEQITTTKEVVYCELRGIYIPDTQSRFVSTTDEKFQIFIHYGGETHNGPSRAGYIDKLKKTLTYGGDTLYWTPVDNMTTALNIMNKEGWEFVQAYTSPNKMSGPQYYDGYVCHYILKRSNSIDKKE